MPLPIAVQLYSVRDILPADFTGVVRRIAAMGYQGVETAGFPGSTPEAAARLFRALGLTVCSAHVPMPTRENQAEVFDTLALLGCARAVVPWQPPELFQSLDGIARAAEALNEAARLAAAYGVQLFYHNHAFELQPVAGRPALYHLLERLDPAVMLEVDTYWARVGGVDPAALLRDLGPRAALLHIKDGPGTPDDPMVAVGDGVMDFPAVLAAADGHPAWLIVELDRCATDMMTAVERSYRYLSGLVGR
ncbi:MAG: sugar phosphate isomerase/epimerase [Caldilineales bacterium]|nr:sugar phosphate isomerase/epimerase [Caldilineales bacterium]MDW8317794.1 sugar phosphate isomerase/epimerase [Anaerolineae bacterium]